MASDRGRGADRQQRQQWQDGETAGALGHSRGSQRCDFRAQCCQSREPIRALLFG
jgi:hypothetical protein